MEHVVRSMENIDLKRNSIIKVLIYFFIYSFIGWCIETIYVSLTQGTFVNRGFLRGPICPIYGFGCLILIIILNSLRRKNLALFIISALIATSLLEYITSILLETLFNMKLWDYSNELLNIGGRICIKNSIIWSFGAILITDIVHPRIQNFISQIPLQYRTIIAYILLICFLADMAFTFVSLGSTGFVPEQVSTSSINVKVNNQIEKHLEYSEPLAKMEQNVQGSDNNDQTTQRKQLQDSDNTVQTPQRKHFPGFKILETLLTPRRAK